MNSPANAFFSYVRSDDSDGYLSKLREFLSSEVHLQWGSKFEVFQDTKDIRTGQEFEGVIKLNLDQVSFLIAILTPSYFRSKYCRYELEYFLKREKEQNRNDLVIPIYYVDCDLQDENAQANDPLIKKISQKNFFDWRSLRTKQFDTEEVRGSLVKLGRHVVEALKRSNIHINSIPTDDKVDELVRDIKAILGEIRVRVEGSPFRRRFRAEVIRRVLIATREEIQKLSGPQDEYEQNLSLQENFIVRAGAIFEEASNICAISIDELSQFWIAEDQRTRAQEYTSRQPENTKRLFVFSNIENALKYRNVLAAHDEQYGRKGGAFFCTMRKYREFLTKLARPAEVEELARKDFAILVYEDPKGVDYYEATLSRTTLVCRKLQRPQSYQEKILTYFEGLAREHKPGEMNQDGFVKWDPNFKVDNELWVQVLRKTFEIDSSEEQSLLNGNVYHLVFLSKNVPEQAVLSAVNDELRPKLTALTDPTTSAKLLEEFWFGTRSTPVHELKVLDGVYKGQLTTGNLFTENYPHCFVMKFRSMDMLQQYYENEVHSHVRRVLYSLCDKYIGTLYEMIDSTAPSDGEKRETLFHAVEGTAGHMLLRADYIQQDALLSIVQLDAVPFELPRRGNRRRIEV
jgi:hypothetical protein